MHSDSIFSLVVFKKNGGQFPTILAHLFSLPMRKVNDVTEGNICKFFGGIYFCAIIDVPHCMYVFVLFLLKALQLSLLYSAVWPSAFIHQRPALHLWFITFSKNVIICIDDVIWYVVEGFQEWNAIFPDYIH